MKILNWLYHFILIGLILSLYKFISGLTMTFIKVFWILIKISFKLGLWLLYFSTRILTKPFRLCFPPKSLNEMSGIDFERFVTKWLALEGYRKIKLTSKTFDYGVDVLAVKDDVTIGIQCKRYSSKVGISAVQEITAGLPYYDCQKGIVITNSDFTQNAENLAASNGIELIDGEDLMKSRAAKTLVKSKFSLILNNIMMTMITLVVLATNVWIYQTARLFLPLSIMFLIICILCLINGICEVKNRNIVTEEEIGESCPF